MKLNKIIFTSLLPILLFSNQVKDEENIRIKSLEKYQKVLSAVSMFYVDELKFSEIIDKSIIGLLSELDSHSTFLDKQKLDSHYCIN